MRAVILGVGNEVLSGRVVNTNASYLARELETLGIDVAKHVVVGDDNKALRFEIAEFFESGCDILITTGGLGPTHDDFTKEVIFDTLGLKSVLREEAYQTLVDYFGKEFASSNIKQAYYPKDAILLPNVCGTAMGVVVEKKGKTIISLVGPPYELERMYVNGVKPYLEKLMGNVPLIHEFNVMGIGESDAEDYLLKYFEKYKEINIAPYASMGKIRYQITAHESQKDLLDKAVNEFRTLMNKYIVSEKNEPIEEKVVHLLKEKKLKISFAESCTGGMLASQIINVDGSSSVIGESLVTYSNEAKMRYLNVSKETIDKYNVVSDEVVSEMADGLYSLTSSDICVTVSGIAGPTGGSEDKPVGLVHYCIKTKETKICEHIVFRGGRNPVRIKATLYILYRIYKILSDNGKEN